MPRLNGESLGIGGNERAVARFERDRDAAVADHRAGVEAASDGEIAARKFLISEQRVARPLGAGRGRRAHPPHPLVE